MFCTNSRKAATDDDLSNKKAFQSDKIKKNAEEAKTTQSLLEDDDDSDQDENKADTSISLPKNAPRSKSVCSHD